MSEDIPVAAQLHTNDEKHGKVTKQGKRKNPTARKRRTGGGTNEAEGNENGTIITKWRHQRDAKKKQPKKRAAKTRTSGRGRGAAGYDDEDYHYSEDDDREYSADEFESEDDISDEYDVCTDMDSLVGCVTPTSRQLVDTVLVAWKYVCGASE